MSEIILHKRGNYTFSVRLDDKTYTTDRDGVKVFGETKRSWLIKNLDDARAKALAGDNCDTEGNEIISVWHCKTCFNKVCDALGKGSKRIG